jgi:hypothetical protein
LINQLLTWLQHSLGKGPADTAQSWSEALLGSLNFWSLLEGTHLLTLMLFAGTIFVVDLRLLGVTFRKTPVSVVSDRVLPLTVVGFLILLATGLALFFAKPVVYYHSLWFRAKMIFLVLAMINIAVFHTQVQRGQSAWDNDPSPPGPAKISAIVSLVSWFLVIAMGRYIPYNFVDCGKPLPHLINVLEDCKTTAAGALDKDTMVKVGGTKDTDAAQ